MSNQNDLDDQLYILLASMKEYREAIEDDNKRLETFYNKIASGVLEQSKKTLNNANQEATRALQGRIHELDKATDKLNYRFIALLCAIFLSLVLVFLSFIFLFIPSFDEIKERRAEAAWLEQRYNLDIKNCNGKSCVRIMKNDCHGPNKDYCVIDPKWIRVSTLLGSSLNLIDTGCRKVARLWNMAKAIFQSIELKF